MHNKAPETNLPDKDNCWKIIGVWGVTQEGRTCPKLKDIIHCRNCAVYSSAGRRLLDREIPADYIQEWTGLLSKEKPSGATETYTAFVFRAGGEWMALPAGLIQEVVNMGPIHSIPHRSTSTLRGLVNIRGRLEMCLSIGGVLGLEREFKSSAQKGFISPERLIVASLDNQKIVFPVSEVMGIVRYKPDKLRNLPVTVSGSKAYFMKGILFIDERDVGLLDEQALFDALTRNLI